MVYLAVTSYDICKRKLISVFLNLIIIINMAEVNFKVTPGPVLMENEVWVDLNDAEMMKYNKKI